MRSQMWPPSGVYFTALDSRLMRIWLIRVSSPTRYSWRMPVTSTWNSWDLARAMGWIMASTEATTSLRANRSKVSTTLPLSILETSRMSLMRLSRCCPEDVIFLVYSRTLAGLSASLDSRVVKPNTAFMGVRISWDMLDRKVVLDSLAIWAAWRAWASCWLWNRRSSSRSFLTRSCCRQLR